MKNIRFELRNNMYEIVDDGCQSFKHLAVFLWNLEGRFFVFKWWLLHSEVPFIEMPHCQIYKDAGFVSISMKSVENVTALRVHKDQFIKIIDNWRLFQRCRPKTIDVICSGDQIILEGQDFLIPESDLFSEKFWPKNSNRMFVESLVFYITPWGQYEWQDGNMLPFNIVAQFLVNDLVLHGFDFYRKWLADEKNISIAGEISFLRKVDDAILIKDVFCILDKEEHFAMTHESFAKMLNDWELIFLHKPETIAAQLFCGNIIFDIPVEWVLNRGPLTEFIEFELHGNMYGASKIQGQGMNYFASFLSDASPDTFDFKWWASQSSLTTTGSSNSTVHRIDGFIEINDHYFPTMSGRMFNKSVFIKMLDDWRDIQRLRPGKIVVMCHGYQCVIKGENFSNPSYSPYDNALWPDEPRELLRGHVVLSASLWGRYGWMKLDSYSLNILARFLTEDVTWTATGSYRDWLQSDKDFNYTGEQLFLKKIGNYVVLKDAKGLEEKERYVAIAREQFSQMLDAWDDLIKSPPKSARMCCTSKGIKFEKPIKKASLNG